MKKQLQSKRSLYLPFCLAIGLILAATQNLSAQRYFELRDVAYNNSAMGGDNYDGDTYHYHADGVLNAQWKFELVQDSFYTLTDRKHNKMLGAGAVTNNLEIYHYDIGSSDYLQWCLVDVDGRGLLFYLKNKKYNTFLSSAPGWNGNLVLLDTSVVKEQAQWRLVQKFGTGSLPKDVKGKEIKPTTSVVFTTSVSPNSVIEIYGLPQTLCGDNLAKQMFQGLPGTPPNDATFMNSFPKSQYGTVDQTRENAQNYPVSFYVNSFARMVNTSHYVDLFDPFEPSWQGEKLRDSLKFFLSGNTGFNGLLYRTTYDLNTVSKDYNLPFGTANLLCRFFLQEQNINTGVAFNNNYIQIPCQVSGIIDHNVPILGWTTEPQVPYLVLHDPPGDGSTSSFSQSKSICRKLENTYQKDNSLESHLKVKVGVAGSAGFIVTTDFEFSVEFGVGATAGDLVVSTDESGTCIVTNEGFSTSGLDPNLEEGSDVFIGYGYDLNYGKYRVVDFVPDSCESVVNERLVYSLRGTGQDAYRKFVLTEGGIRNDISSLQTKLNDPDQRVRANAKYQIEAWERVLAANDSVIASATESIGNPIIFNGGGQVANWAESITISNSSSLKTEHYLSATTGLETVLEFGGSGTSFGFNYKSEKRYGETTTQSGEASKVVSYSLSDNENGDYFRVNVLRDGRFGTPLFQVDPTSKSSCPYEGGYQRDQPHLKIDGQTSDHILLENVQGEVASFKLDLCNESNESRTYQVSLGGENPGGATVKLGGNVISSNPYSITVDPNSCDEDYVLTVQRNPGINAYPNLQIDMRPACDGSIVSSVNASVYFGITSAVTEQSPVTLLSVFPNPTSGELTADFSLETPADVRFELYDMVGNRSVLAAEENFTAGPHRKEMNVGEVPSGIYQLAIKTDQSVISRKVIVQH